MNNVFFNNINALAKVDKALADKIASHILTDVPQLVKEGEFYNLKYKDQFLHNKENPLAEAQIIFQNAENTPTAIHIVYGLGLGYLFQIVVNNSLGATILFEPDLNILRIAFTLVDFTKEITRKNVFITNDFNKLEEYLHRYSNTQNSPLVLSTSNYREMNQTEFDKFLEELHKTIGMFALDLKYTQERFYPYLTTIISNIPLLLKEIPLVTLKNVYMGKTAVIASAGPTLARDIEYIKKYRDSIVLITVGTAIKTLAKNGITPDFVCSIEAYDSSKQFTDIDLSSVNLITEPFSNANFRTFGFRNIYSTVSNNTPINEFWSKLANIDTTEYISKGTVAYTALNTARILGCSKIVMVGQDLAYLDGQCYSKDSAYQDLICQINEKTNKWEIVAKDFDKFVDAISNSPDIEQRKISANNRLRSLNNSLYSIKGIEGNILPTESVYATFAKAISEFTEIYPNIEYINCSLKGAQIDGFKNISIEEALKDIEVITNRDFNIDFQYNIDDIKNGLLNSLNENKNALVKIENGKSLLKNIKNTMKRQKNIDVNILKELKKNTVYFMELSQEYVKTNIIFDFITTAERITLDYEMKMIKEFNYQNVANLINNLANYYEQANIKTSSINLLIEQILGAIS